MRRGVERVVPVIERIAGPLDVAISIDTSKLEVMRAAVTAGACIVNDIRRSAPRAHASGRPRRRSACVSCTCGGAAYHAGAPDYHDVVSEVGAFLSRERAACIAAGVAAEAVVLDPGLGFGRAMRTTCRCSRTSATSTALGSPLLVGVSRKSLIGRVLGRAVSERLYGGPRARGIGG